MFQNNKAIMSASCSQWGLPNNSEDEINIIKDAIHQVETSSGVDAHFILSIVMQESKRCVRVQTTDSGVINPGMMQSHEGSGSCNKDGSIQNPCPQSEIHQMIMAGVEGFPAGPGLKALIAQMVVQQMWFHSTRPPVLTIPALLPQVATWVSQSPFGLEQWP
ncbi:hypothetical protein N7508_007313 [Penicillium antarcticum]|nr:uncharacterized protein N7508_007313 [Penicillium antarcticum]KAJ5300070.1 hypothetical protein N7508_007313 [Penicillium antarcticum]